MEKDSKGERRRMKHSSVNSDEDKRTSQSTIIVDLWNSRGLSLLALNPQSNIVVFFSMERLRIGIWCASSRYCRCYIDRIRQQQQATRCLARGIRKIRSEQGFNASFFPSQKPLDHELRSFR